MPRQGVYLKSYNQPQRPKRPFMYIKIGKYQRTATNHRNLPLSFQCPSNGKCLPPRSQWTGISLHFLPKRSLGERQLCCQSCRFQRQAIPSMKLRRHHFYWAMAAALDLHREVALPIPLHKGLRPLYFPPHQLTLMRFCKIFCQKILQKNSRHPIQLFHKSFDCRLLYLP